MATSLCPCLDRRVLKPLDAGLMMENARERDGEADNLIKDNKQPNEELSFSSRQKPSTSPQLLV